jgi:2-haloacid dehalogenase
MAAQPPAHVIFDLGGVLIDWNPRYLYRRLFDGDEAGMERFLAEVCSPEWNLALDAGRPFAEAVAELCRSHPHERARIEAYHHSWLEMVAGPIDPTVAVLEALAAAGVPLWALTNWSAETFALVRGQPAYAFLDRFRAIFVSGELQLVKPDSVLYRHVLDTIGAAPEACLFIDDSPKNVAGAEALGIRAHHFTDPASLRAVLADHGLLARA